MKRCADCGQTVERVKVVQNQWGHPQGNGHDFCCRVRDHPIEAGRIIAADYHWVDEDGEVQRHFDVCPDCGTSRDIEADGSRKYHFAKDRAPRDSCRAIGHDMRPFPGPRVQG